MLSKIVGASVIGVSARESTLESLRSGLKQTPQVEGLFNGCKFSVKRLYQGPEDWEAVIQSGEKYTDKSFKKKEMLYTFPHTNWFSIFLYNFDLFTKATRWVRLGEEYPDNTLFGTSPTWSDTIQGGIGNCYMFAGLGALAEFPSLLDNIFLNDINDSGIYALRFHIRGKPWIITVDDETLHVADDNLFKPHLNNDAQFASIHGDSLWVPIFEKAWAKMKGNYEASVGGWTQNPFRALTGAPVFEYWTYEGVGYYDEVTADVLHNRFMAADDLDYLLGAGTDGSDTGTNECGIIAGHAYTMLSVFELKTGETVDHKMYMLRNPWGIEEPTIPWTSSDEAWTSDYISQVPLSIDPTTANAEGIFFVESTDFQTCFQDYHIGHLRDGYDNYWYDEEGDDSRGSEKYTITVPAQQGDLYFSTETYIQGTIPRSCTAGGFQPLIQYTIYQNDEVLYSKELYEEQWVEPYQVFESDYAAGDVFKMEIDYLWDMFYA